VGPQGQAIVAWAHSTVGTARTCAPSLRQQPTQYILGLNDLIGAGYIVVATDYPGLGTVGPVGYLIGKGQAYAVLDSVRAAARLPGIRASKDYGVYGFSQGGHATLFAGLTAAQYMPEFRLKALAAIAPPSNLLKLFSYNASSVEGKILISYVLQSWAIKYGLSLRDALTDSAIKTVFNINRICIDDFSGSYDAYKAQGTFGADMFLGNPLHVPSWRQRLIENSANIWPLRVPLLVVQGTSDSIVHPEITDAAFSATCMAGGNVKYVTLTNRSHSGSAQDAFPLVTNWLSARLAGQPNDSSCRGPVIAQANDSSRR
jgi:dipeptidyl aminopeptidase/acylaminoacyl peptidase